MANQPDEEDDYMSDAFLAMCEDKRPGLSKGKHTSAGKRQASKPKKKSEPPQKSLKVQEKEKRDEGLQKSLGSENKGFRMLQKMGFKQGMILGKSGEGRSEPVPINLRAGRTGLGHTSHQQHKQKQAELSRAWNALQRQKMEAKFRERLSDQNTEQQAERDLYKSQRACHQLDEQKGVAAPAEEFFWPAQTLTIEEDEEEEKEQLVLPEQYTTGEKLVMLTEYLRSEHLYCIWCGTAYNDAEDLRGCCPGNTSADHDE